MRDGKARTAVFQMTHRSRVWKLNMIKSVLVTHSAMSSRVVQDQVNACIVVWSRKKHLFSRAQYTCTLIVVYPSSGHQSRLGDKVARDGRIRHVANV